MQILDLIEAPLEGGNRLRHVEQGPRQGIALMLIGLERALSSIQDRAGQQLRVPECVTNAMSSQRVFKVAGVADERPARAVRLPEMPGDAREATQAADQASSTDIAAEMRRVCSEDLEEGALDVSVECVPEGCARHGCKHAVLAMVRGDDACRNVLSEVPVITAALQAVVITVDVTRCTLAIEIGLGVHQRGNRRLPAIRSNQDVGAKGVLCPSASFSNAPMTWPLLSI